MMGAYFEGDEITHCNNPSLADKLRAVIENRYHCKEILVVPTRGLSSTYASDKGIVIAFQTSRIVPPPSKGASHA